MSNYHHENETRLTLSQISGSAENVRALFEKAGIQAMNTTTPCGKQIFGYYPCDDPPRIGFKIGGVDFDFEPSALRWKDDGANNCTALITGHYDQNANYWVVGQAWMQGKYIDHDTTSRTMGFAKLKDPVGGSA